MISYHLRANGHEQTDALTSDSSTGILAHTYRPSPPTDRQTDRQTDRPSGWLASWLVSVGISRSLAESGGKLSVLWVTEDVPRPDSRSTGG